MCVSVCGVSTSSVVSRQQLVGPPPGSFFSDSVLFFSAFFPRRLSRRRCRYSVFLGCSSTPSSCLLVTPPSASLAWRRAADRPAAAQQTPLCQVHRSLSSTSAFLIESQQTRGCMHDAAKRLSDATPDGRVIDTQLICNKGISL